MSTVDLGTTSINDGFSLVLLLNIFFSTSTFLLQSSSSMCVFMLTKAGSDANQDLDGNWQIEQPEIFRCGNFHFCVDQRE